MGRLKYAGTVVALLLGAPPLWADEAAVKAFLQSYVEAFNRQDLPAVVGMWAENAAYVDRATGQRTEGRAAVRADLEKVFGKPAKMRLAGTIEKVRMIKPDVAQVEGTTTTSVAGEEDSVATFSAIVVKQGAAWQIDSLEELPPAPSASAAETLQDLAWLVGNWVDESKDAPVVSTFRWSEGKSFLIRTFSRWEGDKVVRLGTQIIGFDPRSRQIRSWIFNADGSFGDGVWSKSGNDWRIQSSQTLSDGRAASGTYVLSPVSADAFTLQLLGHEIDGEPQPAAEPMTITRAADTPTQPATSPQPGN